MPSGGWGCISLWSLELSVWHKQAHYQPCQAVERCDFGTGDALHGARCMCLRTASPAPSFGEAPTIPYVTISAVPFRCAIVHSLRQPALAEYGSCFGGRCEACAAVHSGSYVARQTTEQIRHVNYYHHLWERASSA